MRISFKSFERCLPEVKNLVFLPYDSREKETIFIAIVLRSCGSTFTVSNILVINSAYKFDHLGHIYPSKSINI